MSAAKKGLLQAAYPVWVGSLDATVDEAVLTSAFQHFGTIHSVVVQKDEFGRSKCFGYVNFTSQSHAEKAAKTMNSKGVAGKKIKTKGPKVLQTEGYFVSGGTDYRPLTDCRYFMKRGHCKRKKKKICPYRHNDIARYTTIVCKKWQERECLNKNCIMLHPGGLGVKRSSDSNNDEVQDDDGVEVIEYPHHSGSDDDDDDDDYSTQSEYDDSSSAIVSTHAIGDNRLSNEEVARMMDLDFDDNDDYGSKSRLRRKASSSSSSVSSSCSSFSDSSDEEIAPIKSQRSSKSKLSKISSKTKLNEDIMSSDGEETTVKVKHSKTRKTSGGSKIVQASLEPVGIFWDIENCKVPNGRSAFHLAQKFRQHFVEGKREVEFMCVCDTLKETGEVINDLNKAHVTVVHVSAVAKNAADDKLRVSLRRFADTYDSPATVVMVTSDVNFSNDLHDLRHRHMFSVVLIHNQQVSYALKACAHRTIVFEEFIADIPNRGQDAAMRMTYAVTVKGFSPSLSRFKVKDRLLYLTENCGGSVNDVCDIKSGTARVRFRTYEAALRAQRRLHGANMFGYPLMAILEQPQQPQPRPQPMSWKVNDHPLLPVSSQQQHLLQPHPFQQQYPPPPLPHPNIPVNYNLSASFPPASTQTFNIRPPLPAGSKAGLPIIPGGVPAELYLPKPPQATTKLSMSGPPPIPPGVRMSQPPLLPSPIYRDQEVITVGGKGRIVIDGIKAVLDKTLVSIPEHKLTGEIVKFCLMASVMIDQDLTIYWHSSMQYIVVVTVDLMKTSQVIQTGPTPSDVLHNQVISRGLLNKCCSILAERFRLQQLPWIVQPCTWPQQQEEMIKIRSQVIKILKEHDYGWASWTSLSMRYNDTVKGLPIIPAHLEACCRGAVELQGTNMATMVAILTEMSPNVYVSAEPSVPRRLVRMIKKHSEGVPLLNLVGMYWKQFGPLPMEVTGKKVLNLLMFQKGFRYDGHINDWITVKVYIMDTSKLLDVVPPSSLLNKLHEEFRRLLQSTPGQRIQLDQFQPSYQTHYKKSFRVSEYGKDKLVDLLNDCPHVWLTGNVVYLQGSLETSASNSSLHLMSSSPPVGSTSPAPKVLSSFSSPPGDDTDITELYKSIKQALVTTGDGKITLNGLKSRLMTEQKLSMNADYLLQLLSECDFLKIEETKDEKTVSWSEKWLAERKKAFAKECKEVLGKEKTGELSLQKFPEEFCRVHKRQLACADYGSKKLLSMLEDVSDVEIVTAGSQTTLKLKAAASNMPSLSVIKLQLEEYLWSCPEYTSTQVKLKPGFEASTKYKLDYSAYGYTKLTFMLEAMSDTIKLTGDGPNRLVSLQLLRKFACEVRKVMESYPSGLCFSNFAPAFRSCLGYECVVGHYGNFSKLSQLFEGIPDTAKVIGEGMAKKVYLTYSKITNNDPLHAGTVTNAGSVAWNILRLLVSSKDHMIPLGDLAGHYNNAFSHQIKLSNYGHSNMEAFLSSLPSIVVKEQDGKKVVTSPLPLLFVRDAIVLMIQCEQHSMKWSDFLANYQMNCNEPFDTKTYSGPSDAKQLLLSCSPWILVENVSSGMILRLPPFARTEEFIEAVNNSNVKLRSSDEEGNPVAVGAGKDYRRLISETKRLLLMSPMYSLTLAEVVKHFVANSDPICSSVTELEHALASTQHSFLLNAADSVLSVDIEARKKKLSKDFLYLFNKLSVWKLNVNEVGDQYEGCFYTALEPHLYGCSSVAELVKCKYINQSFEISLDGTSVLLSYAGNLNILAARFAELLFVRADNWTYINCFDAYQQHFGTSLELSELRVDSIEELINKPNLKPVVTSDGGILKLRSPAMLTESLRHLLTINNGKIQLDQLPQLFNQAFSHLPIIMEDTKLKEWIGGSNILSVASQVVHLNNNQWLVWAPGAYPYPRSTVSDRDMYSYVPLVMAVPTVSSSAVVTHDNSHILHGHGSIGNISTDSTRLTVLSPSHGRKTSGGTKKKNMAIKFPSAKPQEDIPPLLESSNDEL